MAKKLKIDWQKAKNLFDSGVSCYAIGKKLGCDGETVQRQLAKLGCAVKNPRERIDKFKHEHTATVHGFRLIIEWSYQDPWSKVNYTIPPNLFITRPYPNGEFRCALFPGHALLIPRALLRRTRAYVNKKVRDEVLLGKLFPASMYSDSESESEEDNKDSDKNL